MGTESLATGEIRYAFKRLHGSPGLAPTLLLEGEMVVAGFYPGAAALITCRVYAYFANSNVLIGDVVPLPLVLGYPLGQAYLGQAEVVRSLQVPLSLQLDAASLMRFEDLRQGREFSLQLDMGALLTSRGVVDPDEAPPAGLRAHPSSHPQVNWQERIQVGAEDWPRVLNSWGRGIAVPLGVALPELLVGADHAAVLQRLQDALDRMNSGDFKGSLAASREAVELLRKMSPAATPVPKDAKDRDVDQRRHMLLQALFDLTSAAVHPDVLVRDVQWSRRDALLALASTAAVAQCVL